MRAEDTPGLAARYGRTGEKTRRDRWIAWAAGAVIVAVFAVWVVWVAFDGDASAIESRDLGHKIISEHETSVSFEISMQQGNAAECALQVQNESHAIVGWNIVKIPASDTYTRAFTDVVRTSELGVTGLIYRCWLV